MGLKMDVRNGVVNQAGVSKGRTHTCLSKVSWKKKVETLCIFLHCSSILLLPWLYFFMWTIPCSWPFLIFYTIHEYIFDKSLITGECINKKSGWLCRSSYYKHMCDYFPIRIHKTVELKPTFKQTSVKRYCYPRILRFLPSTLLKWFERTHLVAKNPEIKVSKQRSGPRYIFGYHPHGIIAFGICGAFMGDGLGTTTIFPGIECFLLTLASQFMLPFYRNYLTASGVGLVTKQGIQALLDRDRSVAIVIGGASESLLSHPGSNSLILNRRKGFIRLALEMTGTGTYCKAHPTDTDICLVPVYGFGETDVYNSYDPQNHIEKGLHYNLFISYLSRALHALQEKIKSGFGFTLPFFWSRGIFNYDFGLLPNRSPINVVVGKPICVKRLFGNVPGDPVTDQEVDHYHKIYVRSLLSLFQKNEAKYLQSKHCNIEVVG